MHATGPTTPSSRTNARRLSKTATPSSKTLAICPGCGAILKNGAWIWGTAPSSTPHNVCPACDRVRSNQPAAVVLVPVSMLGRRRPELFALIRNIESIVKSKDPLERIISVCDDNVTVSISTTGERIGTRIAIALSNVTRTTVTTRVDGGVLTLAVA